MKVHYTTDRLRGGIGRRKASDLASRIEQRLRRVSDKAGTNHHRCAACTIPITPLPSEVPSQSLSSPTLTLCVRGTAADVVADMCPNSNPLSRRVQRFRLYQIQRISTHAGVCLNKWLMESSFPKPLHKA